MSIVNNKYLMKSFILLAINSALSMQLANAADWYDDFASQSGFSEFAPPAKYSTYGESSDNKQWESGRSFNKENSVRYSPKTSKNPWKPANSSYYKQTFTGQRPWGNVPERKPPTSNMKFHDQRFKQWLNQRNPMPRSNVGLADPFATYAYPGSIYGSPLITPSIYSGLIVSPASYGGYPLGIRPYSGLSSRPWLW
jgi:hypothetical protein